MTMELTRKYEQHFSGWKISIFTCRTLAHRSNVYIDTEKRCQEVKADVVRCTIFGAA